jgi:hypothetical protein
MKKLTQKPEDTKKYRRKNRRTPSTKKLDKLVVFAKISTLKSFFSNAMKIAAQRVACLGAFLALAMAMGAPAQNLFVTDTSGSVISPPYEGGNNAITEIMPDGTQTAIGGGGSSFLRGLAFDSAGDLFVSFGSSALGPGGIREILSSGMEKNLVLGGGGEFSYLACDSSGNVYASDGRQIVEITPGGTQTTFATGLNLFRGLAFNTAGDLFAAQAGSSNIVEITPGGTQTIFASGITTPQGLAFDSAGDLFASEGATGNIIEITSSGMESTFASGLYDPHQLAFNDAGDLFVSATNGVVEIAPNGTESLFAAGLVNAYGLAFQPVPEPGTAGLLAAGMAVLLVSFQTYKRMGQSRSLSINRVFPTNTASAICTPPVISATGTSDCGAKNST